MTGPERRELAKLIDQARRKVLRDMAKPAVSGHCKGCSISFEDTPERMSDTGCWHCRDRIRRKDQRKREQADAELRERRLLAHRLRKRRLRHEGPLARGCSGCGQPYERLTEGCKQCYARHARNRRHRPWVTA